MNIFFTWQILHIPVHNLGIAPDDVDHLVDFYDSTLRDIIDQHAPLRTKEMPSRPMLPWYNKNIQAAKTHKRYCVSGCGSGPVCVFI